MLQSSDRVLSLLHKGCVTAACIKAAGWAVASQIGAGVAIHHVTGTDTHTCTCTHTINNDSRPTVIFTSCCSTGLSAESTDMKSDTVNLPSNLSDGTEFCTVLTGTQNVAHETTSNPKPTPSTPQQWNHWQSSNKCPNFHTCAYA